MKTVIFVGQAPSKDTDGQPPFTGRSGRRLAGLCNMAHDEFLAAFDLVNLLDRWPGKAGKGDAFPMNEARENAATMDFDKRSLVIFVGRNVARAFGIIKQPCLELFRFKQARMERNEKHVPAIIFPHPSGINRWWNDPRNVEKAARFMRSLPNLCTTQPSRACLSC